MKLGRFHLLRDSTYRKLSAAYGEFQSLVRAALGPDSAKLLDHAGLLAHSPLQARIAKSAVLGPDIDNEQSREATERVVAAFRRAAEVTPTSAPSMWDMIGAQQRDFVGALAEGKVDLARWALARMFHTRLVWGLGQVDPGHPSILLHPDSEPNHLQLKLTDTLVSLAEAFGAVRLTCPEQDPAGRLKPLDVDLDVLLERLEAASGLDVSFPKVGAPYGGWVGGQLVTIDSLTHSYSVHRFRQFGAKTEAQVAEIGGGYGCLAALMHRAGFRHFTVYDLPWVNALQGYFLIMALPPGSVRLFGEPEEMGTLQVLPHGELDRVADRSVDYVVNTDSLPEMGEATARGYVATIHRILRGSFYSVNQEVCGEVPGIGPQNCVAEMVAQHGGFHVAARHRYWMRPGYVEEVFVPNAAAVLAAAA
jgi:hypothetical protein